MENDQALPETAEGEVAPAAPAQNPAQDMIDAWFNEFFHNSLVSRDAQIFNYCQTAKEELKRRAAAL